MLAVPATPLRARLSEIFRHDPDVTLRDDEFDRCAREMFAFQFEYNAPYAAYCQRRRVTPDSINHWTEVPPVPTAAFKEVPLVTGRPENAALLFRTSGTTRGPERRGTHYIMDPKLYEEALLPMFAAYLLPDTMPLAFVSLIPSALQAPDSSLSCMVTVATEQFASIDAGSYLDPERGLLESDLERTVAELTQRGTPILLLGTSFAFVHWLDSLAARDRRFVLPEGSRLMDTGGFKSRGRSVPASTLRAGYADRLGLPEYACINEYGMTELGSQFYDTLLRDRVLARTPPARRSKRPAPWVRTRAVDPETLAVVPEGEVGILQHFDLANLYSVLAVQTEDLGRVHADGFEMLGRPLNAVPRGCSIALDILLEAVADRS